MFSKNWQTSERKYGVISERDVKVPISDGITLNCDIFRPDSETEKFPALLVFNPYGVPGQVEPLKPSAYMEPPLYKFHGMEKNTGHLETGDPNFFVRRGYIHAVCSLRGTSKSEGKYPYLGDREAQDGAEVVEWLARQRFCNGNVGLYGFSYMAWIQLYVASKNPPHLKCIFAPWGAVDQYREVLYHGGLLSVNWLLYWPAGGLTYANARPESISRKTMGEKKYKEGIDNLLADPDISGVPELARILKNPDEGLNPLLVDMLLHPYYDEYWEERRAKCEDIKVPSYVGGDWGTYFLHLQGAFRAWDALTVPKKMIIGHSAYLDRPVYQVAYEALRWFDFWLKGVDTKIMSEPPIRLLIENTGQWRATSEWPLEGTKWTPFYLHEDGLLSEHEHWPSEGSDSFEDSPWKRGYLTYSSPSLLETTEIIGPILLELYASSSDTDIFWVASFSEINLQGEERMLTRGWLRGSHREIDPERTVPWEPYRNHAKSEPLVPKKIYEFVIPIVPTGTVLPVGYSFRLTISSTDDPSNTSLTNGHLRRQNPSRITVYHDEDHPSQLILPITSGNLLETFMSKFSPRGSSSKQS